MIQKITGEAPFQVLATNFSIGPSQQDYTLQISANGSDYSDLFTVSAGQTKMVTNVANGSYYRLKNNESEVTINWRTQCNDGQSGGGGGTGAQGPQGPQGATGAQGPQGPAGADTSGSTAYKIELSTNEPDDFTEGDIANLNDFFDAVKEDPSIVKDAYLDIDGEFYRCSYEDYDAQIGDGTFMFVLVYSDWIDELQFTFLQEGFDLANHLEWNGGDNSSLNPTTEFPSDPVEGQIVNYSDERLNIGVLYRYDGSDWQPYGGGEGGDNTVLKAVSAIPQTVVEGDVYAIVAPEQAPASPDGQTVYGGNLADFEAQVGDNNDEIWVKTYDDAQHTEWTDLGYFGTDKNGLTYYNYQGDKTQILDDFPEGEWSNNWGGVCVRREGENVYFYVESEANGVFFSPAVSMNFDIVGEGTRAVYQAVASSTFVLSGASVTWTDGTAVDYNDDGTFEQIVTDSSNYMYITVLDGSLFTNTETVCSYETYGNYYPLEYNSTDDEWYFNNYTIRSGENATVTIDGTDIYLAYDGTAMTINTSESKGWQEWNTDLYGEETVISGEQLAKLSDIPEAVPENRLVPRIDDGNWNDGKWLRANGWNNQSYWSDGPREVPGGTWDGQSEGKAVVSTNEYATTFGWSSKPVVQSSDVLNIVKITVSDYETLVANDETDPNTLYLTYEPEE